MSTQTIPAVIDNAALVARAGTNVPPTRVIFEGSQFNGTGAFKDNPEDAIAAFSDVIYSDYEIVTRDEEYPGYTLAEIAVAMLELADRNPYGKSIMIHIGDKTPATKQINVGYRNGEMQTRIIHDGDAYTAMSLPGFVPLGKKQPAWVRVVSRYGTPVVSASVRRMDQGAITGYFEMLRDWADSNTIYKGQCIGIDEDFHDLSKFNMRHVAMTDQIRNALNKYVVSPLHKMDQITKFGMSTKSGILFEGEPGGGKTMTKTWAEKACVDSGGVVIRIPAGSGIDGFRRADRIAQRLMKAGHMVMWTMEDVEVLSKADRSLVLDILDGSGAKDANRIIIATTNDIDRLEEAFKRPGRWNAILHCGLPDLAAFKQMTELQVGEYLAPDIDWVKAFTAYTDYTYAFIGNCVDSIIRSAITRGDGDELVITTQDLMDAGLEQRDYFDLVNRQQKVDRPPIDELFSDLVYRQQEEAADNMTFRTQDETDYGSIESIVDNIIESRLHGASVNLRDENGINIDGNLNTN